MNIFQETKKSRIVIMSSNLYKNSSGSTKSVSQYSICTTLYYWVSLWHFIVFVVLFSNSSFSTFPQQIWLESYSDLFLNFYLHCSLNKVLLFSGFLMCITMKLRNVASWQKWLSLVYAFEVKQINSAQKFGSYLLAVPYILTARLFF